MVRHPLTIARKNECLTQWFLFMLISAEIFRDEIDIFPVLDKNQVIYSRNVYPLLRKLVSLAAFAACEFTKRLVTHLLKDTTIRPIIMCQNL